MSKFIKINDAIPPGRGLLIGAKWLGLILMTGCGAGPSLGLESAQQEQKLIQNLADAGYVQAAAVETESVEDSWQHDNTTLQTLLTMPKAPGSYPLILYLPGLGEHAKAGQIWRDAWVKSGYAVLSLQSTAIAEALQELNRKQATEQSLDESEDEGLEAESTEPAAGGLVSSLLGQAPVRRSALGRSSELRYLGHQYFAADALQQRVGQLYWLYQQIQLRQAAGQLKKIDLSRVIIAGYDLGAQTVAAIAGEKTDPPLAVNPLFKPLAAIAISPSVNLAKGQVNSRFKSVTLPLLVVTGTDDSDPYAVSVASSRTLLWEYAAPGNKYLLVLNKAGHRILAGSEAGGRFAGKRHADAEMLGPQGGKRRMADAPQPGGFGDWWGKAGRPQPDLGYKQVAAVASVTAAFLDATVKNDEFARFWLSDKAAGWLKQAGELRLR